MADKALVRPGTRRDFGSLAEPFARSRLTDRRYDDSPQLFRKPFDANFNVFSTSGEPSFGDLYFERHCIRTAGVRDDEFVLPALCRCDLNRALRSGRVVLTDFRAGGVVDEKVHVSILQAVR